MSNLRDLEVWRKAYNFALDRDLDYITEEIYTKLNKEYKNILRMLTKYKQTVSKWHY